MKKLTKAISALLAVVMLMGVAMSVPFTVSADEQEKTENTTVEETTVATQQETSAPHNKVTEPITKSKTSEPIATGSSDYITRVEWLHSLTETFNMTVEENNYPDNYYSDISSSDSYYRDVMVAVEFGVIDLEAGEAFYPNDYTTRDFAASTLNFCLGYKLDSESYTFSDVSSTQHPADAQVAINRGWFELENNKFEPEKYITAGESTIMLEDAVNTISQEKVNNNYSSEYEFADDVIVVPKSVPVSIDSDGTITLTNYSETISSGNTFAVYAGDVPDVYTAVSVTKSGSSTVIKTKETEYDSAVTDVNAQGTSQVLDSYFEVADGVELVDEELEEVSSPKSIASVGAGTDSNAVGAEGNLAIKSKTLSKDLKIGDLKINLKVVLSNLNVNYIAEKKTSHYMVKLDGDAAITTNVSMQDVISALGGNSSVDLASYSVPGVGKVAISVFLNVKGEATITYDTLFSAGIEYTKNGGCRAIKSFTKKSFTVFANVTVDAGLKVYAKVNILELLKGEIYATTGVKVVTSVNAYDDGKKPELCINIKGWWYVTLGYGVTIIGQSYSDSLNVFNANNSPARLYAHYEDGKEVSSCTREASETKYISPSTTKYGKISAPTSRESGSSLIDITYGSTTVDESWTLTSNREIYGDLNFKNGTIDLNGYTLTVYGNLIQSDGVMYINNGTLNVGGDYRIQTILSNGDVADSSGYLRMTNNADLINIKGNFITQSSVITSSGSNYNYFSAGTMKIGGNFYQYNGDSINFSASGSHMVIFEGDFEHIIHLDSTSSNFHKIKTSEKSSVVFDNGINNLMLYNDLTINGDTTIKGTLDLNGYTLTVNGNLNTNTYAYIKKGHLIVNGNYEKSGYIECNGGTIDVNGNLLQNSSISLGGGTVNISGNLTQVSGCMSLGEGTLNVGGDYRIQTILSNGDVADSSGYLRMTNNADLINIKGNFITQSSVITSSGSNYNYFSAGTMKIGGNFYQYNGDSINFSASGSHLVVLNGSDTQLVHFDSKSSHFNYLELTKDKTTGYVFDPDNCWNKLITKEDINSVKIYSQSTTVKQGDNLQFISKINGSNVSTVDVIWSISDNTDSNTTISDKGILSVSLNEKAEQITVTATSVADNTKSASVTITIEEIVPVINGIVITPSVVSTVCGESCQFNAVVFGLYNPNQNVIWSISGNKSSNTQIDSAGLLKIADDETSDKITVKAVSCFDISKTASVTVDVMQIKITSTVDNVTVTMETGETQKLKAIVTGTNNPSQRVVWSVSGNNSENTVINDNGEITIGKDETSSVIIVKAVSAEDSSKYGEFAISVKQSILIGDVNGDGSVDVADATILQKYINKEAVSINQEVADTNGDGKINIRDATQIQKYIAKFVTVLG
ncbi:MAG: dockerin type I domain-containing protein [Ruminococcus sp.]